MSRSITQRPGVKLVFVFDDGLVNQLDGRSQLRIGKVSLVISSMPRWTLRGLPANSEVDPNMNKFNTLAIRK